MSLRAILLFSVAASMLLHGLLFALIFTHKKFEEKVSAADKMPIKINLVKVRETQHRASIDESSRAEVRSIKAQKSLEKKNVSASLRQKAKQTGSKTLNSHMSPLKGLSYDKLLAIGESQHLEPRDKEGIAGKNLSSSREEFVRAAKNYSKIHLFAQDLSEYVSIPESLIHLSGQGNAKAIYHRQASIWKVSRVDGDKYVRAILYEALCHLQENGYAHEIINASEYADIEIRLNYTVVSDLNLNPIPLVVEVKNNRVTLDFSFKNPDSAMGMGGIQKAQDGQQMEVSVDLIAVAVFLKKKIFKKNYEDDVELRRLRNSSAFAAPIKSF